MPKKTAMPKQTSAQQPGLPAAAIRAETELLAIEQLMADLNGEFLEELEADGLDEDLLSSWRGESLAH